MLRDFEAIYLNVLTRFYLVYYNKNLKYENLNFINLLIFINFYCFFDFFAFFSQFFRYFLVFLKFLVNFSFNNRKGFEALKMFNFHSAEVLFLGGHNEVLHKVKL